MLLSGFVGSQSKESVRMSKGLLFTSGDGTLVGGGGDFISSGDESSFGGIGSVTVSFGSGVVSGSRSSDLLSVSDGSDINLLHSGHIFVSSLQGALKSGDEKKSLINL